MNSKDKLGLFMLGALTAVSTGESLYDVPKKHNESEEERKERITKAEEENKRRQGLTKFFYGENSIWALNQKTADKKAKRKGWI